MAEQPKTRPAERDPTTEARRRAEAVQASYNPAIQQGWELDARGLARDVLRLLAALEQAGRALEQEREIVEALRERAEREPLEVDISDYSDDWCAGFLAGQANALDYILDAALASSPGAAAPGLLTRDEKISLRTAVGCLREDYPHASGLPHAESALRKLRATQADTDATEMDS